MSSDEIWVNCEYILPSDRHGLRDHIIVIDIRSRVEVINDKAIGKPFEHHKRIYFWNGTKFSPAK